MIHLDTQVAVWLYGQKVHSIPLSVRRIIARESVVISPIVLLEYELLRERGRVPRSDGDLVEALGETMDLGVSSASLSAVVERARSFVWTRDPFDRLIVANAMADGARLVTADGGIRENFKDALWAD